MTDKDKIKFAIRYLKKGLKSKRTPPLYEELMNELGFVKKVNNLSSVAVDFFKENYPEYVTEKGECLSPYWDLFSAGVICATFELKRELGKVEGKLADLTSEYYELENLKNNEITELTKDKDYFSDALDKQIEATIKLLNDFNTAKDLIKNIVRVTWGEGWNYDLGWKVEAEKFLKECE